jgi:putative sigma-54 modulation protein
MTNKTLNIKATHLDSNDEIRNYVESRINSLDKFIDATEKDTAIYNVEVGKTTTAQHTGDIFRAEINLSVHGKSYRSESTKDHLFAAMDVATQELENQLLHHKSKRNTMFRRGAQQIKNLLRWGN